MSTIVRQTQVGDPATLDTLEVAAGRIRPPSRGEILVRIAATSLNYHDYGVVTGLLGPRPGLIPMSDGAGTIEAVGEDVADFAPGDAVVSLFFPHWVDGDVTAAHIGVMAGDSVDGYGTNYTTKPASWFVKAPRGYAAAESATLPCAALTAWRALMVEAKIKPGDWVLTQGTGGVSMFAVQFAKAAGARVIATTSADAKMAALQALGADHVLNYRAVPDWGGAARDITDGKGVDVVVEIGGAGTLEQSIRAVRIGGHISLIGVLAGWYGDVPTARLMGRNIRLNGITVGSRAHQLAMIAAIEANGIRPAISHQLPLESIAEAFRIQEKGTHIGKIVVDI